MPKKRETVTLPTEEKKVIFLHYWRIWAGEDAPQPLSEFYFAKPRRFRFDWAFVNPSSDGFVRGVAVEVDGGSHMIRYSRSGQPVAVGRHNQDSDRAKLNLAAEMRWLVLRYSPKMIERDPVGVVDQVLMTLEAIK